MFPFRFVFFALLPVPSCFCTFFFLGPGDGSSSSSELLSLSSDSPPQSCKVELPPFPSPAVYGLVGGFYSDKNITLCGGASHDNTDFKECFTIALDRGGGWSQVASLPEPRAFSSCNPGLAPGSLIILGGRSGMATLDSSKVWQPNTRKWECGPILPHPITITITITRFGNPPPESGSLDQPCLILINSIARLTSTQLIFF